MQSQTKQGRENSKKMPTIAVKRIFFACANIKGVAESFICQLTRLEILEPKWHVISAGKKGRMK